MALEESDIELPDILTDLEDKNALTRRSIHRILAGSKRLDDFRRNRQQFIELAAEIITRTKRMALVDGIKYQRIGDDSYYAQELFESQELVESQELSSYLKSMIDANKSVHEMVIYQSGTERTFAEDLEKDEAIKIHAKLPSWFTVPTPLGPCNPDWAILVNHPDGEKLYLVVETKNPSSPESGSEASMAALVNGAFSWRTAAAAGSCWSRCQRSPAGTEMEISLTASQGNALLQHWCALTGEPVHPADSAAAPGEGMDRALRQGLGTRTATPIRSCSVRWQRLNGDGQIAVAVALQGIDQLLQHAL